MSLGMSEVLNYTVYFADDADGSNASQVKLASLSTLWGYQNGEGRPFKATSALATRVCSTLTKTPCVGFGDHCRGRVGSPIRLGTIYALRSLRRNGRGGSTTSPSVHTECRMISMQCAGQ
eukprot:1850953-Amphidinium_carterae.1